MNRFDIFAEKFNFKRAVIIYLIAAILTGILSAGFLAYTFRDKITFVYKYHRINEKANDNKIGFENLEPELINLANSSSDIVDILILNRQNQILFSAKNSNLSKNGILDLAEISGKKSHFLADQKNSNVYFRLMKGDKLKFSMAMLGIENEVEQEYADYYFYEKNYNVKKVYLLSYITDKLSGDKVYFISDIRPIVNGEFYVKIVAVLAILFFMLYWVLLAFWVYAQALKSKLNSAMWGIITLFTNLAGLFVFLIYRQGHQTCYKCGALQNKSNLYCTFCGTRLGFVCKKCNTIVSEKDNYCKNCGSVLKGERKQNE
ncbi:zinc ribbon domain-containing protein [Acidilutibacter cellobiosedens]|jgi:RNA polymerase subunit RPABC4/transcription elongation factor Spt4|uniref:Zinc ribbon domain-containing protein n=1 Tax=Acidilutibacter cellobiosedens TaxID=2507161 RepID=A0A410QGZ2_9FIRM|nr:zinc ribbon domain-containing protein [Acidilutibacter cellobiosedens]MBE6081160.1 zinc ribbon domain-containing protein [Tissierellaceae bacterium]QAT63185.1 zinc ribbon domain-containing protein [Acidilutibacter cellobiosedens]